MKAGRGGSTPATSARRAIVPAAAQRAAATNARATRLALLVAAAAAQFAVMPLLSGLSDAIALGTLLGVGLLTMRMPLPGVAPRARPGVFKMTMAPRQAIALVVIMVGAIIVLARVDAFDANSKAAALATLLLVVQVAHVLALQTRREATLGCAIVIVMLAVGAAFAGDIALIVPVLVALPAVAVTAALLHRGLLIESADVVTTGGTGSIVRACVTPVALATVVGLGIFLALPNTSHLHVQSRFASSARADGNSSSAAGGGQPGVSRSTGDPGTGAVDLGLRGPLSTAPVFEVAASSPAYWQGAIFGSFDGRAWLAAGPLTPWNVQAVPTGTVQVAPLSLASSGSTRAGTQAVAAYAVRVLSSVPLDAVFGPGSPVSYSGPGLVLEDTDGTAHLSGGPGADDIYRLSTQSPANVSDAALRVASGSDPSNPMWLSLPSELPTRVGTLAASLAAGQSNRFDTVNAVEDYLRTHEQYNLNSPLPAHGDDAVDDFVFVSHQGFCEQFASAAVVMLRTLGIPARLVTGYVNGDLTSDPGARVFRGTDAHAWVQVFYPGVGWVNSDPTAGATLVVSDPSIRSRFGTTLKSWWHAMPLGRTGALLGVVGLLVVGLASGEIGRRWARRRRRFAGTDRGRAGDGPVLASYLRLDIALRRVERARAPAESFGELAQRLGGVVATATEVAAALAALECETYSPARPSAEAAAAAIDVFDRLRAAAGSHTVAVAAGVR